MAAPTFLFAGGGTGGHLYPGLAIAEAILAARPDAHCRFLCSERPLDAEVLAQETLDGRAVEFEPIPAKPFGLRPGTLWRLVTSWGSAVRAARGALSREPGPVVMVAMGGFVAAPAVQAARAQRAPRVLVNLDAVPGRANGWIARHATRVLTAAPASARVPGPGWEPIPPIVRRSVLSVGSPGECRRALGLEPERPTLLVTGASQGAETINGLMRAFARSDAGALAGWQVIHQTGKAGLEQTRGAYEEAGVPCLVRPFFERMSLCWGSADLALSRAGAGSVGEAWATATPTLFLPYPYHRDQHQHANARALVEAGGALVLEDLIDPDANLRSAGRALANLLGEPAARDQMRAALRRLGPADGAERAARVLLAVAGC
jgi:UDP-N-acetylglucosamine--N-acetylmuramyl-(pentapeptide) pyrophosphoryl-undecaprenol N-acetylglucosamine transferase